MNVRRATVDDAAAIGSLELMLFGADAWPDSSVTTGITEADRIAAVATQDEVMLGYAMSMRSGDAMDVHRIGVHPDRRRLGTARALLAAVTERAGANGVDRLLVEVSDANPGAIAFYTAEDFVEVSRRARYYRDDSDAIVMERKP